MKRIINGITYDTDTATLAAEAYYTPDGDQGERLYQTRHGAFFLQTREVGPGYKMIYEFKPLTDDEAQKWLETHANHLVEHFFGPFPEYGGAERRLTVRIPAGLHRRVESAASSLRMNVNRYIMHSLEKSVAQDLSSASQPQ